MQYKVTGGARIGRHRVSWPFAKLILTKNLLTINCKIGGNYSFLLNDIISIVPYKAIPLLAQGIRIYHRKNAYPEKIIFVSLKNPQSIIDEIKKTDFIYFIKIR